MNATNKPIATHDADETGFPACDTLGLGAFRKFQGSPSAHQERAHRSLIRLVLRQLKEYRKLNNHDEEIGNLANLETLFPASICRLSQLNHLSFSYLPEQIGNPTSLEKLCLNGERITYIPSSIGRLQNLKDLDLSGSHIGYLPPSIGQLQNLKDLDLSGSHIGSLPPSIGQLQNLKNLDLSETQWLIYLPEEIGNLTSLEKLNLNCSSIISLPPSIGQLQNLKHFDLSFKDSIAFFSFSTRISLLHQYQKRYGRNRLSQFPVEICDLTSLETLNLQNSRITPLPPSIEQLISLTKNLSELPEEKITEIKDEIKWSKKPNYEPSILDVLDYKDKLIKALTQCPYDGNNQGHTFLIESEAELRLRTNDPGANSTMRQRAPKVPEKPDDNVDEDVWDLQHQRNRDSYKRKVRSYLYDKQIKDLLQEVFPGCATNLMEGGTYLPEHVTGKAILEDLLRAVVHSEKSNYRVKNFPQSIL